MSLDASTSPIAPQPQFKHSKDHDSFRSLESSDPDKETTTSSSFSADASHEVKNTQNAELLCLAENDTVELEAFGRARSIALLGIDGYLVSIEANISQSLPAFVLLGLPDAALNEAKERIKSAALNSGVPLSKRKITVNLTPASLPKKGSSYDIAIVMAILEASGIVSISPQTALLGELGLDGKVRPVSGILPMVAAAKKHGMTQCVVPLENLEEASLVHDMDCVAYATLKELVEDFSPNARQRRELNAEFNSDPKIASTAKENTKEKKGIDPSRRHDRLDSNAKTGDSIRSEVHSTGPKRWKKTELCFRNRQDKDLDLQDVKGQAEAKYALEIAAAGGHHIMMVGSPGAGKTMLASRLPSILPPLTTEEALEVTAIRSLESFNNSIMTKGQNSLIYYPPFENPHHTSSAASIIGGGHGLARPGAASRAHHGVLFLDETPEFDRKTLEALRQPLEAGEIIINRSGGVTRYPAKFQLVLAANPCPCGYSLSTKVDCICNEFQKQKYQAKISGPLADRVDMHVTVHPASPAEFAEDLGGESSADIATRVIEAKKLQKQRLGSYGYTSNAAVPGTVLRTHFPLPSAVRHPLDRALERGVITGRTYDRLLKVAWTIADLKCNPYPTIEDIHTSLMMRGHDL